MTVTVPLPMLDAYARPASSARATMWVTSCPVSTAWSTSPLPGSRCRTELEPSVVTQSVPSPATATPCGRVCRPSERVSTGSPAATSTTVTVLPGRSPVP